MYDLPIPVIDGLKADKLRVHITGTLELDRTSEDDLAFLEGLTLGRSVSLAVNAVVVGRPQQFSPSEDGPGMVTAAAQLKVTGVVR